MSSARGSAGSPCTVISRNDAFSLDVHCAVSRPGTLTHGVSIERSGVTHGKVGEEPTIVRPYAEKYACNGALPPPSAAGLVHAATMPGSVTLPNRVFAGGGDVDLNDT